MILFVKWCTLIVNNFYGGMNMHKLIKKLKNKNWTILMLNAMALVMVIQNVNATCFWVDHQPEVPEEAQRFKKQ